MKQDTGDFVLDHKRFARTAARLSDVSSELDELSSTYELENAAREAERDPGRLLAALADLLAAFRTGLSKHFAREEGHFPRLAGQFNAVELTRSLTAEHEEALRLLDDLTKQARMLAGSSEPQGIRRACVAEITGQLRSLLAMLSAHAEKEDEVLFIAGQNE